MNNISAQNMALTPLGSVGQYFRNTNCIRLFGAHLCHMLDYRRLNSSCLQPFTKTMNCPNRVT